VELEALVRSVRRQQRGERLPVGVAIEELEPYR